MSIWLFIHTEILTISRTTPSDSWQNFGLKDIEFEGRYFQKRFTVCWGNVLGVLPSFHDLYKIMPIRGNTGTVNWCIRAPGSIPGPGHLMSHDIARYRTLSSHLLTTARKVHRPQAFVAFVLSSRIRSCCNHRFQWTSALVFWPSLRQLCRALRCVIVFSALCSLGPTTSLFLPSLSFQWWWRFRRTPSAFSYNIVAFGARYFLSVCSVWAISAR